MFIAYAINFNLFDNEDFIKHLNLEEFYGCFLHKEFQFYNDNESDRFLMDKSQIKYIKDNYKNGASFRVRVVYGYNDYKDGIFYYWYHNDFGDRGLISDNKDKDALDKFKNRQGVI